MFAGSVMRDSFLCSHTLSLVFCIFMICIINVLVSKMHFCLLVCSNTQHINPNPENIGHLELRAVGTYDHRT